MASYTEGSSEDEFGDSSVIHMLTGWTPYTIPLKPSPSDLWKTLSEFLPMWKRPESEEDQEGPEEGGGGGEGAEKSPSPTQEKRESNGDPARSEYIIMSSFSSHCSSQAQNPSLHDIVSEGGYTVEPPNKRHLGISRFVLC